jgi:hypothetical protein
MKFMSTTPLTARQVRLLQVIEASLTQRRYVLTLRARGSYGRADVYISPAAALQFPADEWDEPHRT